MIDSFSQVSQEITMEGKTITIIILFSLGVRLLLHNGSTVSNNSVVGLEDLPTGTAFLCSTDARDGFNASWISPTGDQTTTIFAVNLGASILQVERTASPLQAYRNGVWHCEIPNRNNIVQLLYVGLYTQGKVT
jgi:hypothetical protein